MADIKKLKADVKAAERDVANKVTALKNASSYTAKTYSDEQLKFPEIKKFLAEKRAIQAKANDDLIAAKAQLAKVEDIALKAVEEAKTNPTPADAQKARDEANRRGEIAANVIEDATNAGSSEKPDDFAALLKSAKKFISDMSGPNRKLLAQQLNDSLGLNLPVSELVDPSQLLGAYQSAISGAQGRYRDFKDTPTVNSYLNQKKLETAAIKAAGGSSGASNLPYGQIYDKTAAKAKVNEIVKSVLNREATAKEVADLSAKVIKAQKDNPYRTVNGRTVGGLNVDQFLTDLVQANPEYAKRKAEGSNIDAQAIRATARANMLELSDVQVNNFLADLKAGQDIKTINSRIRNIAAMGMPDSIKQMVAEGTDLDTIYQPYKTRMAAILELNPESININDATLRSAIGPDKEMPLYEFEKALRKDSRWQYTNNARNKVSEISARIRRDFGFEA
jgi:hypothetical protein